MRRVATFAINHHKLTFLELAALTSAGVCNSLVLKYACVMQKHANSHSVVTPGAWGTRPDGNVDPTHIVAAMYESCENSPGLWAKLWAKLYNLWAACFKSATTKKIPA